MNSFTTFSILAFSTIGMQSASVITNYHPIFEVPYYDAMPYKQSNDAQLRISSYSIIAYGAGEKKDFKARYAAIAKSEWFKKAYFGKSLGDIIKIED